MSLQVSEYEKNDRIACALEAIGKALIAEVETTGLTQEETQKALAYYVAAYCNTYKGFFKFLCEIVARYCDEGE